MGRESFGSSGGPLARRDAEKDRVLGEVANYQGYIFFRGDNRGGLDPYTLSIQGSGSFISANFGIWDAADDSVNVSAPIPGLDQWLDIAGTLDDATGTMRLYINGVEQASTVTPVRPFATLDPTQQPGVGIGNTQSTAYNSYFQGLINEVRLCDVALTPGQFLGSTPGNVVVSNNGSPLLNEPASDLTTLTLDGSNGNDTFDLTPESAFPIVVRGPGSASNDTLVLPQWGTLSGSGTSGALLGNPTP